MRLLLPLLLICSSLGCRTHPPETVTLEPSDPINPVTVEQLQTAKQRIHLVRADMTDEQLFASLGISSCYGRCIALAGGPFSHSWVSYTLRNGHALHVVRNITGPQQSTLRSVDLDGVRWTNPASQ
jgi:hypothetical protein